VASNYTTAGSATTVRVLSGTSVVDVEAIGIYTKPSNVFVVVQVPLADFLAGKEGSYLFDTADLIEGLLAASPDAGQRLVSGVDYIRDTDGSGLFAGFLAFTVRYLVQGRIAPPFTATVTIPVTSFESAAAFDAPAPGGTPIVQITNAYERLKALANS